MQGKIIKGISGFYYVHTAESGVYECKAKGSFRRQKIKPLVGDDVRIDVTDETGKKGNVIEILPRKNELIRPAVANIDQALLIFAAAKPEPHYNLLDRFLVMMRYQEIPVQICFNKCELLEEEQLDKLADIYRDCGCEVFFTSAKEGIGLERFREALMDKTTAVAGPSGVGKSSLINQVSPQVQMQTGEISRKIERGRHTTRHSELIHLGASAYIMDTPGFSSLYMPGMEKEALSRLYPEFEPYEPYCRFKGCVHIHEPDCGVKQAVEKEQIHPVRYENYCLLYAELEAAKKY